ncbi:MAG TPA: hypothetical protein VGZ25_11855 [Gemmataceae bacterium]|nr:hypothetical protein [Gemmataceae bacterium]
MYSSWRASPLYMIFLIGLIISGYYFRGHNYASVDTLTKKNYDLIKIGMDQEEVDDILTGINEPWDGPGTCSIKGSNISIQNEEKLLEDAEVKWEHEGKTIRIQFKNAKVTDKSQTGLK